MKKNNSGANAPVLIILAIVLGTMIYATFDPATAIGRAPLFNKIVGWLFLVAAGGFLTLCARDMIFPNMENEKVSPWLKIGITAALITLALLILAVFHSGPLGTTTNPL